MPSRVKAYIILLIVSIIWGIAGPIIKFTLREIDPWIFLTYRFFLSALVGTLFISRGKIHFPKDLRKRMDILIYGFLTSTVSLTLLFWGFDKTSSLSGSVLGAISPIMVAAAGVAFLREHVTKREKVGIAIAFVGTLIMVVEPFISPKTLGSSESVVGNLLVILSNLVGVITAVLAKKILRTSMTPTSLTHISFIIGFLTIIPIALAFHSPQKIVTTIASASLQTHAGVIYMALLSGTLAYSLYHLGQKSIEVGESALFTYLLPIWTAPLSVFWLKESISLSFIIGAAILAFGVITAESKLRKK